MKPNTLRKRVRRKQVERDEASNLIPTFKSGYQSISVWTVLSLNERTLVIRIEVHLNREKYKKILQ